jgi:hypothetical protein
MVVLINATDPTLIHVRETVTHVKVPCHAQNLFKFQLVVDMIGIMKWVLGGGIARIDWMKKGRRPTENMSGKLLLFGSLTAKFSKEINLRAGQMVSKLNGEMVWPGLEYYP